MSAAFGRAAVGYGMRVLRSQSGNFGRAVDGYRWAKMASKKAATYAGKVAPYAALAYEVAGTKRGRTSNKRRKRRRTGMKLARGYVPASGNGHDVTQSYFTRRISKPDGPLKEALPEVYRAISSGIVQVPEGEQKIQDILDVWPGSELQQWAQYDAHKLTRFYVESGEMRIVYTNVTSTPVKLSLYDLKCKSMGQNGVENPTASIIQSLSAKYNNGNQHKVPYQSIKEGNHFSKFWKIVNEKNIVLNPGETHEHYYKTDVKKYFENQDAVTVTGSSEIDYEYVPPYTSYHICRAIGTPVTDGTQVSTATCKVIYMTYKKLTYKRPQGAEQTRLIAYQANEARHDLATEKTMNEDTMTPTPNTTV